MEKTKSQLTSAELINRWGIDEVTLANRVYQRILPADYDWGTWYQPVFDPSIKSPRRRILIPELYNWTLDTILAHLGYLIFKIDDIEKFEQGGYTVQEKRVEKPANEQFVFKKAGPGWIITFDGNLMGPFKGKGFDYLHYLIQNARREYSNLELDKALNARENILLDRVVSVEGWQEKTDSKALGQYKKRLMEIAEERRKAEVGNDQILTQALNDEAEEIGNELKNCRWYGKTKSFSNVERKISNKVSRAIGRALDHFKVHNEKVYEHFKEALGHPHSLTKHYNPTPEIPWIFE